MDQIKRDNLYDKAAMRVILQPLVEDELAEFDTYNQISHEYSAEFMDRIRGVFRRDNIKRKVRRSFICVRKVLIYASVAIVLLLAACAAVKPIRDRVADAFVKWYEMYAEISYTTEDAEVELKLPTLIPDGYIEIDRLESDVNSNLYLIYVNDEGKQIIFDRSENQEAYELLVDREHVNILEIDFRGMRAIYLEPQREENMYSLIWQEKNVIYCIHVDESKEILIEFAESVK